MSDIFETLKFKYKQGNMLWKLIYINVAVFLAVSIFHLLFWLFAFKGFNFSQWLAVPADFHRLMLKPWTVITYMFYHEGFFHILFNLIVLYFAGIIFQDFLGERRLLTTYIAGGMSGAFLFIVAYSFIPALVPYSKVAVALGASAAIMAVLVAIATYMPNYSVNLMFIGAVKLKYIAIFYVVLDIIGLGSGGHIAHFAHIGGAIYGFFYIKQMQRGKDWSNYYSAMFSDIGKIFKPRQKLKVKYRKPKNDSKAQAKSENSQARIDAILDKISKTGYDSLTKAEKDELFKASQ